MKSTTGITVAAQAIAAIFADVLEIPGGVAGDSDFFELGGNSMQAGLVIAQVRRAFGVRLTMRDIFTGGTPEQLAEAVATGQA